MVDLYKSIVQTTRLRGLENSWSKQRHRGGKGHLTQLGGRTLA
jgi:hypothetical protein